MSKSPEARTTYSHIYGLLSFMTADQEAMQHLRIGQWLINAAGEDLYNLENRELIARIALYASRRDTDPLPEPP